MNSSYKAAATAGNLFLPARNLFFSPLLALAMLFAADCTKLEELDGPLAACDAAGRICPNECTPSSTDAGCDNTYWTFLVQNRSADAPEGLSSWEERTAERVATSDNLVLYRELASASLMNEAEANQVLADLETAMDGMRTVYGGGLMPDVQNTGRIVLLAVDIRDDYSNENKGFVNGFVSPSDLFNDDFTTELFNSLLTDPNYYTETYDRSLDTLAEIAGRSNEDNLVYLDLKPFFNGDAFNGDKATAYDRFIEAALHELSHLVTYNKRVVTDYKDNHDRWIAEGLAEQAPMLLAERTETQKERLELWGNSSIQAFLRNAPALNDFNDGSSLVGYLQSNLFFNYLRHLAGNFNERNFIATVTTHNNPDHRSVEKTVQAFLNSNESFAKVFRDWIVTNYLESTGRTATQVFDSDNQPVDLGNGQYPSEGYNYSYKGVDIAGGNSLAFPTPTLPTGIDQASLTCLNPTSVLYFDYIIESGQSNYTPFNNGMNPALKIVVGNTPTTSTSQLFLYNYDNEIALSNGTLFPAGRKIQFMVYNPNTSGGCLTTGLLPWDSRNLTAWLGGGGNGWKTGPGAPYGTNGNTFNRPSGVAYSAPADNPDNKNYIYVTDIIGQGISRWDADTGAFAGRMGSLYLGTCSDGTSLSESDCVNNSGTWDPCGDAAEDVSNDGWRMVTNERLVVNHCPRNFSAPRGIDDDASYIYIADSQNYRIVRRASDGSFAGWLGSQNAETWQCTTAACWNDPGHAEYPVDPNSLPTGSLGTDTTLFYLPNDVWVDRTNEIMYVVNYQSNRITRRDISAGGNGDFTGFIGNGINAWSTATSQSNNTGGGNGNFDHPKGIWGDATYLYVSDSENNRIVRIDKASGAFVDWLGGGDESGWHTNGTPLGTGSASFQYPTDVTGDGTYLYVSDWVNQRIARYDAASGSFEGWIGGGYFEWEMVDEEAPLLDPVDNPLYPALFMTKPLYLDVSTTGQSGQAHNYLYLTTVYDGRISRWNLDCVADINNTTACEDEP